MIFSRSWRALWAWHQNLARKSSLQQKEWVVTSLKKKKGSGNDLIIPVCFLGYNDAFVSPCNSRGFSHIHRGPLRLNHQHHNQNQLKPAVMGGSAILMWRVVRGELTGAEPRREETDMGWGCTQKLLPVPVCVVIFEIFQDAERTHQLRGLIRCHFLCKLFSSQV